MYISAKCPYCNNQKSITAPKTTWQIHLANHRENIIKHMSDLTPSCVFCAYSEIFANKKHASSHYRWAHKKSDLIKWAFDNISKIVVV